MKRITRIPVTQFGSLSSGTAATSWQWGHQAVKFSLIDSAEMCSPQLEQETASPSMTGAGGRGSRTRLAGDGDDFQCDACWLSSSCS